MFYPQESPVPFDGKMHNCNVLWHLEAVWHAIRKDELTNREAESKWGLELLD